MASDPGDDFFAPQFPDEPAPRRSNVIEPEPMGAGETRIMVRDRNMGALRVAQPRRMNLVMKELKDLVEHFGQRFEYSIPFKDRRRGKITHVTGPTITAATAVMRAYGNCTAGCSVTSETASHWIMEAWFNDVEKGVQLIRPFRQRKSQDAGGYGGDSGRQEDVVFQIAASKAVRNVIVNALRDLVDEALYEAKRSLTARCEADPSKAIAWIKAQLEEYEITEETVARSAGRSLEKMRPYQLAQVMRLILAIRENSIEPEEAFPAAESRTEPDGQPDTAGQLTAAEAAQDSTAEGRQKEGAREAPREESKKPSPATQRPRASTQAARPAGSTQADRPRDLLDQGASDAPIDFDE